jgi:hypothetical protein
MITNDCFPNCSTFLERELCRALLTVERRGEFNPMYQAWCCPICLCTPASSGGDGHDRDCEVDIALTKAGLDTQEKRDAARMEMYK